MLCSVIAVIVWTRRWLSIPMTTSYVWHMMNIISSVMTAINEVTTAQFIPLHIQLQGEV